MLSFVIWMSCGRNTDRLFIDLEWTKESHLRRGVWLACLVLGALMDRACRASHWIHNFVELIMIQVLIDRLPHLLPHVWLNSCH